MRKEFLVIIFALISTIFNVTNGYDEVDEEKLKNTVRDGTCGADLTWTLSGGELTIQGTGPMDNFYSGSPWSSEMSSISSLVIKEGVTSIGASAFVSAQNMKTLSIPGSVSDIGFNAFGSCTSLTNVVLPYGVKTIGNESFQGCLNLRSLTIPETVTSIGGSAFASCPYLKQVSIPTSVVSIGISAFASCLSLSSVIIADGVSSIENSAFLNCRDLTEVTIPASVTSIGAGAFRSCKSLSMINVQEGNEYFASNNGVLFSFDLTSLIQYPSGNESISYTVPDTVLSIHDYAFWGSQNLENLVISDSVISVGESAFSSCSVLYNVTILGSNISFGNYTFYGCSALATVSIPPGITSIGRNFFAQSGLTTFVIPDTVKTIGEKAFSSTSLTEVTIPDGVVSIGSGAFSYCDSLTRLVLPDGLVSIPETFCKDCQGLSEVSLSSKLVSIGPEAFSGCWSLASLTIPNTVTTIPVGAFKSCAFESFTIPDSITSIGDQAFYGCSHLTGIIIPDSVTSIGASAFQFCSGLKDLVISSSVKSIQEKTFHNCQSLTQVIIPESVESIGKEAFCECYGLTGINIPESVTSIGSDAFSDCSSLSYITLPDNLTEVGNDAFSLCYSLSMVFYQGSKVFSQSPYYSYFYADQELKNVCVHPDYNSSQFFEVNVTSDTELCRNFRKLFDHCYKGNYRNGSVVAEKRVEVIDWERRTNSCMEYQCFNATGLASRTLCASNDETIRLCSGNACIEMDAVVDKRAYVDIEMMNGTRMTDVVDMDQTVKLISKLGKIEADELKVGYVIDDAGFLLRVIAYVSDEDTAEVIARAVNDLEKGEGCNYGILCRARSARVVLMAQSVSGANRVFVYIIPLFLFTMIMLSF